MSRFWRNFYHTCTHKCTGLITTMDSLMNPKTRTLAKALTTVKTFVGFLSCMDPPMKMGGLTEALPTHAVLKGFLSCVDTQMNMKVSVPDEAFPTFFTFLGFLPCMDSLMGLKMWAPTETLPTHITHVGFLSGVDPLVVLNMWVLTEAFPTQITSVGFLPHVDSLMGLKMGNLTEVLATHITFVGFLSCVDSLMALKMEIPAEVLIKHITFVGFLPGVDSDGLKGLRPYWSFPHTSHLCGFSPVWTFEEDHSSGWTSCHMCFIWMFCLEGRLFDGLEVVISYWSLYHTAHISKISLQCCPHSNCWGLTHDWSPSYTGHIYTHPPWGEWAQQQEGRSSDWSTQHIPDIVGFLPWVGSLVGLHMWALTQALPILTIHTGLLSFLQLLLKFKIRDKVDAFSILIRGLTFWVDDAMLGCVPHQVFSTIIVAKCHLAFGYFLITMWWEIILMMQWSHGHSLFFMSICWYLREGNGTPLQYFCLENAMDGGAW